jgi:hypothetical protein
MDNFQDTRIFNTSMSDWMEDVTEKEKLRNEKCKYFPIFSKIIYGFTMAVIASILWLVFFDKPITDIQYTYPNFLSVDVDDVNDIQDHMIVGTAKPGDKVYQYIEYCVNKNYTGGVYQNYSEIVDETGNQKVYLLKNISTLSEIGCFKRSFVRIIPFDIVPGKYVYNSGVVKNSFSIGKWERGKNSPITVNIVKP